MPHRPPIVNEKPYASPNLTSSYDRWRIKAILYFFRENDGDLFVDTGDETESNRAYEIPPAENRRDCSFSVGS